IEEVSRTAATGRGNLPPTAPGQSVTSVPQGPSHSGTGMGANRTAVIRWPDSSPGAQPQTQGGGGPQAPPQPQAQAPPPQQAPPQPQAQAPPPNRSASGGPNLPSDRTVVIQWGDGGGRSG